MKTTIKALKEIHSNTLETEGWKAMTHKKELLIDVPKEDLIDMIINISRTLTDVIYEIGKTIDYLTFINKYGGE